MPSKSSDEDLKIQLKKINKKLEEAVKFPQSNPHYVVQVSSEGKILFANKAAENSIFS